MHEGRGERHLNVGSQSGGRGGREGGEGCVPLCVSRSLPLWMWLYMLRFGNMSIEGRAGGREGGREGKEGRKYKVSHL